MDGHGDGEGAEGNVVGLESHREDSIDSGRARRNLERLHAAIVEVGAIPPGLAIDKEELAIGVIIRAVGFIDDEVERGGFLGIVVADGKLGENLELGVGDD